MPRKIASGKRKQEKREVPQWKLEQVKEIAAWLKGRQVVGIVSLVGLPSSQLQEIKKRLRGRGEVRVYRAVVMRNALEKSKELKPLVERIQGPCALITTEDNPFRLFRFLKQNQGKRQARTGDKLDKEIIVPAGDTNLPAGPALAELKMAKIDVRVDKGKILVAKDSPVAKPGDIVNEQLAAALSKLGIKPMPVGVQLVAVFENGTLYEPSVLDVDEKAFWASLVEGARNALNLTLNVGLPTRGNITLLIGKGHRDAVNLTVNAGIPEKETIGLLLSKGTAEASALADQLSKKGFTG